MLVAATTRTQAPLPVLAPQQRLARHLLDEAKLTRTLYKSPNGDMWRYWQERCRQAGRPRTEPRRIERNRRKYVFNVDHYGPEHKALLFVIMSNADWFTKVIEPRACSAVLTKKGWKCVFIASTAARLCASSQMCPKWVRAVECGSTHVPPANTSTCDRLIGTSTLHGVTQKRRANRELPEDLFQAYKLPTNIQHFAMPCRHQMPA